MSAAARRAGFAALVLAVLAGHAGVSRWVADQAAELGEGRADRGPARLSAQFVVDLVPVAPPAQAPAPPRLPAGRTPVRPRVVAAAASAASSARAASAPAAAASAPAEVEAQPEPQPVMAAAEPAAAEPPASALAASAATSAPALVAAEVPPPLPTPAVASPASAPTGPPPFEWPRSTRLSYRLTGYYRGPVEGQARVEWLRDGTRYQVHLEVSVGPSFAPLMSRRMSSDGEIGPDGLQPRRYDEETRVALRDPRRLAVLFSGTSVTLANGSVVPQPAGVQDTASQFVHLTWLFTTQPERLRSGQSVPVMLALPRRVDAWVYDVLAAEALHTPAGPIDAVHVRPRRPERPSGELTAEVWIAPSLQYLPARIVIRQDAETFVDLMLERLPQQAADPPLR